MAVCSSELPFRRATKRRFNAGDQEVVWVMVAELGGGEGVSEGAERPEMAAASPKET